MTSYVLTVSCTSSRGIVAAISGTLNFNLVAHFRIKGASCGFSSACASSSHAMGYAYDDLVLGRQKRMFVVGAEDGNVDSILPFAGMRALSIQTDPALARPRYSHRAQRVTHATTSDALHRRRVPRSSQRRSSGHLL